MPNWRSASEMVICRQFDTPLIRLESLTSSSFKLTALHSTCVPNLSLAISTMSSLVRQRCSRALRRKGS